MNDRHERFHCTARHKHVEHTDAAVERKGREGRKEILSDFASFATSAFDRDVLRTA
jgi:hypothetical protein